MKIKIKTSKVVENFNDISDFLKKDIALPKQIIWDLDENYEVFHHIVHKFDTYRNKILEPLNEKHAFEQLEDGKIKVKEKFMEEFIEADKEINEYLNTENEIEIKMINKKDLPDNISFKDWKALKIMCEDKE